MPRIEHDGVSVELNLVAKIKKTERAHIYFGAPLHYSFIFSSTKKRDEYWDKYIKPLSQWGVK